MNIVIERGLTNRSFARGQCVSDEILMELFVDVICVQILNEMALPYTNYASQFSN